MICRINKKDSNKETTNQKIKEVYKEFFVKIIPICIATIVFCFAGWDPISSFWNDNVLGNCTYCNLQLHYN